MKTILSVLLLLLTISLHTEIVITTIPLNSELYGVCALSEDTVFVTGAGIWRSTNGGINFIQVGGGFVMDIHFADKNIGYALMRNPNGPAYQAPVLKTTNGGLNWFSCFTPQGTLFFTRIYVKNENEILGIFPGSLINQQCQLFRSSNGGANFTMIHETGGASIQGVVSNTQNEYYIAASSCWYSNNLLGWTMKPNSLSYVYAAPRYNGNRLFFAGISWQDDSAHPTIAWSENQGTSWTNYVFSFPGQCEAIDFNAEGVGYAVGSKSGGQYWLASTTNNGQSWDSLITTPFMKMNNVEAVGQTAYVVGKYGTNAALMRYRNTITAISSNNGIAEKFELQQNYPNPFNPSTTIQYSIPAMSTVKITVYNSVGKEISVLVNERKNAGRYETIFNGSNIASGVYFYTIQAGDFTETKKMILIK